MRQVIAQLERLKRRSRMMLMLQRLFVLTSWTIAAILALVAFDFALRLPEAFRFFLLLAGLGGLGYAGWVYLVPAMRFSPTVTQLALRIERLMPALASRLASSVEFAISGVDQSNALAARSLRDTESRLAGESVRRALNPKSTVRDFGILLVMAAIGTSVVLANPDAAQTGLVRLFLPFSDTQWPARTGVESLMSEVVTDTGVFPRGQALPLRAKVTKGDPAQRIEAHYRIREHGAFQPWQRVVLTRQGATLVHERLVDSNAEAIEVYFSSRDDRSATEMIQIVAPPAVRRATLRVTPPSYAAERVPVQEADLGTGLDGRAVTDTPSLIGSEAELVIELNKSIPVPAVGPERDAWLRTTLGWDEGPLPRHLFDEDAERWWALRWTVGETRTLNLDLVDAHGLRNAEPISYRIEAIADHPPTVTITKPASDEAVLASAIVPLVAEAQDDVAVARLEMHARTQSAGERSPGEAPVWSAEKDADAPSVRLERELALAPLSLREGDVVHIVAIAEDGYAFDGQRHEPTESSVRRLRIIGELEFASQLRRQLSGVRQNAIRMEAMQSELQDSIADDGPQPGVQRAQAQIGERIAAQRDVIDEIRRLMEQNRLEDDQLESLLTQAGDLLDFAGRASSRAVEEIARREAEMGEQRGASPEDRPIAEAQQEVREELADLIELLDRDEDTWVVTRQLESILDEQRQLEQLTRQLAHETIGQSLDELSPETLSELDRIAQRQQDLRDQVRQLLESLRQRAESMQDVDPQAASGMRTAAATGEQRELDREMEAAADRVRQNQLRTAQAGQQAAADTLQRMLQDIQDTTRARAEQLLRQLASLIDSIERLIIVQENELSALVLAIADNDFAGRDRAMIRLNQNTQAVAAEARTAGQDARRIARTLDRAADAQGAAVGALRAQPVRADEAEQAEERSLDLLREARELAEQLQQQTQEQELRRRREELINTYRELAERQIALREQAQTLVDIEELDRRQLVEARRLGSVQEEIRQELADLERTTPEISESLMFSHVHQLVDRWSRLVTDDLATGDVTRSVTHRQGQIARSIGSIIEALEEMLAPPEDFDGPDDDGSGGEGGGAGSEELIPDLGELRLLRGIQEQVYNQTKEIDAVHDLPEAERRERLRDLGQQQRDLQRLGRELLERVTGRSQDQAP